MKEVVHYHFEQAGSYMDRERFADNPVEKIVYREMAIEHMKQARDLMQKELEAKQKEATEPVRT